MEIKKIFDEINNIPKPTDAQFIDDKRIEVIFNAPFNELDENSSTISFLRLDLPEIEEPLLSYHDSEILTSYSLDGKKRAVLRQISHQKTMPSTVPKFKEKVTIIEIIDIRKYLKALFILYSKCHIIKRTYLLTIPHYPLPLSKFVAYIFKVTNLLKTKCLMKCNARFIFISDNSVHELISHC